MLIAQVQFISWDKIYNFSVGQLTLAAGDYVIVKTELGLELGKIVALIEETEATSIKKELKPVIRKASNDDLSKIPEASQKKEALEFCREMIKKHNLSMKLVDVHFSWEGGRLNFAFTADGRVDFRDLVKDLSGHFNASIRLTQIGTRDEAKITGDCGSCGLTLCCRGCLKDFCSITSEMAETQQVVHRGSERISGMCGRLKCCLSFEYEGYKFLAGQLPPIGTKVNADGIRGTIINHHVLKQTVDVRIPAERVDERDTIIEVDINRHKKK
ncbi:MAG: regulatory iron-sulfur-containing complex subunit RicT [Patescibacteria group bacterium]|jgi:cell fate regulator YaaT (PSP1 superfamily)